MKQAKQNAPAVNRGVPRCRWLGPGDWWAGTGLHLIRVAKLLDCRLDDAQDPLGLDLSVLIMIIIEKLQDIQKSLENCCET